MMLLLLLLLCLWCSASSAQVVVDTVYGQVEGHTVQLADGTIINSFLAIPFAKPPNETLRWRAPEEPDPWGYFVADKLGSACIQRLVGEIAITHPGWDDYSEDCLHINIYTPEDLNPSEPYPVMVWLHGGGFTGGANFQYPGHFLPLRGVIVAVVNYRLGIFGFASTGDDVAPGNFGLLDQLLGLRFVNQNIGNFGGDPNRVTIFGESAGAGSVGLMMMSPLARDYFQQAILQSGTEMSSWVVRSEDRNPHDWIHQVADNQNCSVGDNAAVMDCLREVAPWDIHFTSCSGCSFGPLVDGDFLPAMPEEIRASGDFAQVPVLEGHTREDGFLGLLGSANNGTGLDRETFEQRIRSRAEGVTEDEDLREEVYEAMLFYFSPWPNLDDGMANLHELGMIDTDRSFGLGHDIQAKLHCPYAETFYYIFGFRPENLVEILPEWLGVPHILDIPYTFGYPWMMDNPMVRNDTLMWNDPYTYTQEDQQYADFIMDLWTNFAKHGNPTPAPVDHPQGGQVTWEQFTSEEHMYIYIANEAIEVRENYRQREYAFWTYYIEQILSETRDASKTNMK